MSQEIANRVFRRDFRELLGFDVFEVTDDFEFFTQKEYFTDLLIDSVTTPLIYATGNLIEIVVRYLEYDPERFPNPLDQYVYIYESRDAILEILARKIKVDTFLDCPISYYLGYRLNSRFERLFRYILTVGNTHKFNPDYVLDHLMLDESDESGTD